MVDRRKLASWVSSLITFHLLLCIRFKIYKVVLQMYVLSNVKHIFGAKFFGETVLGLQASKRHCNAHSFLTKQNDLRLNHLILAQRKMVETLSTSIELLKSSAFAPHKSKSAYLR